MATQRQIEANRRNAQKSTGPRTQAGRERSRMNALKHGLSRKLPREGPAEPPVLPLAQAIVGEGTCDPDTLAWAEQIVVESLNLATILQLRATLFAALPAALAGEEVSPVPDRGTKAYNPLADLLQLARYEQQTLTRRSRALIRFNEARREPPLQPSTTQAAVRRADDKTKPIRELGLKASVTIDASGKSPPEPSAQALSQLRHRGGGGGGGGCGGGGGGGS